MDRPVMHCHEELERDLGYRGILPMETMMRWFEDRYSTSKHLLTLYSIARGLKAKRILEIGFGRSTFVLARAAHENEGRLISCDQRDFSYLLNEGEKKSVTFLKGYSDRVWSYRKEGFDFAFLDYFSAEDISESFCHSEIENCLSLMKTNGIIAIHDSFVENYKIRNVLELLRGRGMLEVLTLPYNYGLGIIRYLGYSDYGKLEDQFLKKPDNS